MYLPTHLFPLIYHIYLLTYLNVCIYLPTSSSSSPPAPQALAFVILWQYAVAIPFLIFFVAIFLSLVGKGTLSL